MYQKLVLQRSNRIYVLVVGHSVISCREGLVTISSGPNEVNDWNSFPFHFTTDNDQKKKPYFYWITLIKKETDSLLFFMAVVILWLICGGAQFVATPSFQKCVVFACERN